MADTGPTVIMVVGVNGSGKTTSIAKLAHMFIAAGKAGRAGGGRHVPCGGRGTADDLGRADWGGDRHRQLRERSGQCRAPQRRPRDRDQRRRLHHRHGGSAADAE